MALDDTYTYPKSHGVLINKFNVTDADTLDVLSNRITSIRATELNDVIKNTSGVQRLDAIHHHLFNDIFDWAGQHRTTQTSNGVLVSARPEFLEENLTAFAEQLNARPTFTKEPNTSTDLDVVISDIAWVWGELTVLHPYRDGNTRSQGIWVDSVLKEQGFSLDWANVDHTKLNDVRMMAAMSSEQPLVDYLKAHVVPSLSITAPKLHEQIIKIDHDVIAPTQHDHPEL